MLHVSWWLVAVVLSSAPFAAAATDYGANVPLLAVETSGPQLPNAQAPAATSGDVPKQDMLPLDAGGGDAADSEAEPAAHRAVVPSSNGHAHNTGPSARNKGHVPLAHAAPARAPTTASWQSLLPGSIQ